MNIFVGGTEEGKHYGTAMYEGAPVSMEEYIQRYWEAGAADLETYESIKQPAYIGHNVYLQGAVGFSREKNAWYGDEDEFIKLVEEGDEIFLEAMLKIGFFELPVCLPSTDMLGRPRITEARYDDIDENPLLFNEDLKGNRHLDGEHGIVPLPGPLQRLMPGKNRIWLG